MVLNKDCIRDILLSVEASKRIWEYPEVGTNFLRDYDEETVLYHLKQCDLAGLLDGYSLYFGPSASVMGLSPQGHAFIENVREQGAWDKMKKFAKSQGVSALDAVIKLAIQNAAEWLK